LIFAIFKHIFRHPPQKPVLTIALKLTFPVLDRGKLQQFSPVSSRYHPGLVPKSITSESLAG
jgi:hypothetical protein